LIGRILAPIAASMVCCSSMKWIVGQAHRLPPENQKRQPTRLSYKKNDIHREKIIVQINPFA